MIRNKGDSTHYILMGKYKLFFMNYSYLFYKKNFSSHSFVALSFIEKSATVNNLYLN